MSSDLNCSFWPVLTENLDGNYTWKLHMKIKHENNT